MVADRKREANAVRSTCSFGQKQLFKGALLGDEKRKLEEVSINSDHWRGLILQKIVLWKNKNKRI